MTSPLLLVLLLGAAQSTGTMSPTSDVSSNRVRATGGTTRSLADWTATVTSTNTSALASAVEIARLSSELARYTPAMYMAPTVGCVDTNAVAGPLTVTRNSSKQCATGIGHLACTLNQACSASAGYVVDPDILNSVGLSREISGWGTTAGSPTMVDNVYVAPDGTLTAEKMTVVAGDGKFMTATAAFTSSVGPFTASIWMRSDTGTSDESVVGYCGSSNTIKTCTCGRADGKYCSATASTDYCITTSTFSTDFVRAWATYTCTTATTSPSIIIAPGTYPSVGGTGGFWGGQIDEGDHPRTFCPTTGSSASTCPADSLANVWPITSGSWCSGADIQPLTSTASWNDIWTRTLISAGTDGSANSFQLKADTSGNIVFVVYDSSGVAKTSTAPHGYLPGTAHEILGCVSSTGELSIYSDGVRLPGLITGAGTGLFGTHPFAMRIGSGTTAGTGAGMYVKGARVCASDTPCFASGGSRQRTYSGADRYIWAGANQSYRSAETLWTTYTFTWPPDPVTSTSLTRRVGTFGGAAWSKNTLSVSYPADWGSYGGARDVSVLYDRVALRYFMVVNTILPQAQNFRSQKFSVFTSPDGIHWAFLAYVGGIPGLPSEGTGYANGAVWSPEWFVDDDGTVYVIVSANTGSGGAFEYHLHRPTSSSFAAWTYVGKLTGTAIETYAAGVQNNIDPFMLKKDGTYVVIWKSEGGGDTAQGTIGYATASSLLGPYNTGGPITISGVAMNGEGPSVSELPSGSATRYRIVWDDYQGHYPGFSVYCGSDDLVTCSGTSILFDDPDTPLRHHSPILGL